MTKSIIRFSNIVLVGLLAGTSFGIWIGLNPMTYSVSTYIEQQQHLVNSLNALMISFVILATLVTIVSQPIFKDKTNLSSSLYLLLRHFLRLAFLFPGLVTYLFKKKY